MIESADLEFAYSKLRLVKLTLGALAVTLLSGLLAFRIIPTVQPGSFAEFIGYVSALFFGLCFILLLRRLFIASTPVLFLTSSGIRDVRVAADEIRWSAIRSFGQVAINRQRFVVIGISPDLEARLALTRAARWARGPNKALGIDGLCFAVAGLNIDFDSFYDLCEMRLRRAQQGDPESGAAGSSRDFSLRSSDHK